MLSHQFRIPHSEHKILCPARALVMQQAPYTAWRHAGVGSRLGQRRSSERRLSDMRTGTASAQWCCRSHARTRLLAAPTARRGRIGNRYSGGNRGRVRHHGGAARRRKSGDRAAWKYDPDGRDPRRHHHDLCSCLGRAFQPGRHPGLCSAKRNSLGSLFAQFAAVAKSLAHPHRLELLEQLAQGERSVEVLADRTGLSIANASQHLQQMRRAGLVANRRDGKFVYYRLAEDAILDLLAALRRIAERNVAEVERVVRGYFNEPLFLAKSFYSGRAPERSLFSTCGRKMNSL